jgi:hypothetical protein
VCHLVVRGGVGAYLLCAVFFLVVTSVRKMLALINRILDWFKSLFWKEEMELTLVGLQYSGKTTFVNVIAVRKQWCETNINIKLLSLNVVWCFRDV